MSGGLSIAERRKLFEKPKEAKQTPSPARKPVKSSGSIEKLRRQFASKSKEADAATPDKQTEPAKLAKPDKPDKPAAAAKAATPPAVAARTGSKSTGGVTRRRSKTHAHVGSVGGLASMLEGNIHFGTPPPSHTRSGRSATVAAPSSAGRAKGVTLVEDVTQDGELALHGTRRETKARPRRKARKSVAVASMAQGFSIDEEA